MKSLDQVLHGQKEAAAAWILAGINQLCDRDFIEKNKTARNVARRFSMGQVKAMYDREVSSYDLEK